MARSSRIAVLLIAGLAALGAQRLTHAQDVTIYRCVDAKGHLTLRDTPCAKDQKQEARTMTRPQDAPRKSTKPAPAADAAAREVADTQVASREIYLAPPRPLYECVTPDGMVYTSDTSDGNPRWVPLWTLGYPSRGLIGSNFSGPTLHRPEHLRRRHLRARHVLHAAARRCVRAHARSPRRTPQALLQRAAQRTGCAARRGTQPQRAPGQRLRRPMTRAVWQACRMTRPATFALIALLLAHVAFRGAARPRSTNAPMPRAR